MHRGYLILFADPAASHKMPEVLLQLNYIIIICIFAGALHKVRGTQGGAGSQPFCCYVRSITVHTVKAPGKAIFATGNILIKPGLGVSFQGLCTFIL